MMSSPIETAVHRIDAAFPDNIAIYLFGSYAAGMQSADSDLDLAILGAHRLDGIARMQVARDIAAELDREIDLIDLRDASTVLAKEVIAKGKPLLVHDADAALDFEARTLSDYGRLQEERSGILDSVLASGIAHAP
jgi:predicted nucleotidyltransferase